MRPQSTLSITILVRRIVGRTACTCTWLQLPAVRSPLLECSVSTEVVCERALQGHVVKSKSVVRCRPALCIVQLCSWPCGVTGVCLLLCLVGVPGTKSPGRLLACLTLWVSAICFWRRAARCRASASRWEALAEQ